MNTFETVLVISAFIFITLFAILMIVLYVIAIKDIVEDIGKEKKC